MSDRPIEIIWISIRRRNNDPLFIGCYYGKQESRCSTEEIKTEMNILCEEIEEMKKEGDIMIYMDGNGKLALLGEEKSRNGKLLEEVFQQQDLYVMNKSEKCTGKITRQSTNQNEKSAIDFVAVDESLIDDVISMEIDEEGLLRMSGLKDSDHNTIIVNMKIDGNMQPKPLKRTEGF